MKKNQKNTDLLDDNHSFHPNVACIIGSIEKAILLKEINGWCKENERKEQNIHFSLSWTFNSANSYNEKFSYMAPKSIARWLRDLEKDGWIYPGNFNKRKGDTTKWHTANRQRYNDAIQGKKWDKEPCLSWVKSIDILTGKNTDSQNEPGENDAQNEPSPAQNEHTDSQNEPGDSQNEPGDSQNEQALPSLTTSLTTSLTQEEPAPKVAPLPETEKTEFEKATLLAEKVTQKKVAREKIFPASDEELTPAKNLRKEPTLHSKAKARFEHWQQVFDPDSAPMYWDGKEIGQLTQMINRLKDAAKKKNHSWETDEDFLEGVFDVFCEKFIESGKWYADCFVPSAIVSKWNIIIQTLNRNGRAKNKTALVTSIEQRERVLAQLIAEDCG